jgi:probable rRNA maturation factor
MIELDLQNASQGTAPSLEQLQLWCSKGLSPRSGDSELTIRLVDETEARELNNTWRHKDYATNVLSFPADIPEDLLDIPLLGDLVICVAVVEREAAEQGKELAAHWAHLVIHGCLHLLGYDHVDDDDALEMEDLERQLLAELNYPDPYADEQ